MRETNARRERNSKRSRDRRSNVANRDRGRFDDENNHRPHSKQRNQKAIGTRRMTDNVPTRPQRTDKTSVKTPKWKMDEFDEKQAKYSTENMSPTELDRLIDLNSDDFDPLAALYTNKKLTFGKAHDCVAQLLRKWDLEDGTIVQKQETFQNESQNLNPNGYKLLLSHWNLFERFKSPMSPRKSVSGKMNRGAWIIKTGTRRSSCCGQMTEID